MIERSLWLERIHAACARDSHWTMFSYWADKWNRELNFVIRQGRDRVDVVECKINLEKFDATAVQVFAACTLRGRMSLSARR